MPARDIVWNASSACRAASAMPSSASAIASSIAETNALPSK
jgi:hypothetical protein